MKIAIPVSEGSLSMHFGHCEEFMLAEIDEASKCVGACEKVPAPPHQPGLLPRWLAEREVNMIIAGGMGQRAKSLFAQHGIGVMVGAPSDPPEAVLDAFLGGTLQTGPNVCAH
jgi:predicted Fe-Mo cluster-binding NifX family protein